MYWPGLQPRGSSRASPWHLGAGAEAANSSKLSICSGGTRGLSILFITHDLSLAHYISERAVILYRGCVAETGVTERIFKNPLHPYTKMLMAPVPRLDKKWEEAAVGPNGKQPQLTGGCVYYERCPVAEKICASHSPRLVEVESDHFVACIHYAEK